MATIFFPFTLQIFYLSSFPYVDNHSLRISVSSDSRMKCLFLIRCIVWKWFWKEIISSSLNYCWPLKKNNYFHLGYVVYEFKTAFSVQLEEYKIYTAILTFIPRHLKNAIFHSSPTAMCGRSFTSSCSADISS